jgi:hypothetical protein
MANGGERINPYGPVSDAELYAVGANTPSPLMDRYESAVKRASYLDIHDITAAERPILATETHMIIRDFVAEDDSQKVIYGDGGIVRSPLLDVLLVRSVMTNYYKFRKHCAFDVHGIDQRQEVLEDAAFVDDYRHQYPEVGIVINLLDEMHARREHSTTAAGALLDLLRVYSKALRLV